MLGGVLNACFYFIPQAIMLGVDAAFHKKDIKPKFFKKEELIQAKSYKEMIESERKFAEKVLRNLNSYKI